MKLDWVDHKNIGQFVAFTPFGSYIAYYGNGRSSCVCNFLAMKTCQYNTTEEAKDACEAHWSELITPIVQPLHNQIAGLEYKVEIATNTLEAILIHENSDWFGPNAEKSKRASWRGVKRKIKKAYTLLGEWKMREKNDVVA